MLIAWVGRWLSVGSTYFSCPWGGHRASASQGLGHAQPPPWVPRHDMGPHAQGFSHQRQSSHYTRRMVRPQHASRNSAGQRYKEKPSRCSSQVLKPHGEQLVSEPALQAVPSSGAQRGSSEPPQLYKEKGMALAGRSISSRSSCRNSYTRTRRPIETSCYSFASTGE